jgi:flagellin-like hook-associated protein FlgL
VNSFKLELSPGAGARDLTSPGSDTQIFKKAAVFSQPITPYLEGDYVIYDGKPDPLVGSVVSGLTAGTTTPIYQTHIVTGGFQLLDASGNFVDITSIGTGAQLFRSASQLPYVQTDAITIDNHGLQNGDAIKFTSTNPIGGLSNNGTYYVRDVSGNSFKLASTANGVARDLTSYGSGSQEFTKGMIFSQPSTAFAEGAQVVYAGTDASGTVISGLNVGNTTYTVHRINGSSDFQLLDASGNIIRASGAGSGAQIFNTASSTLYLQGHGFSVGDQITYGGSSGGVGGDIGGLSRGTVYVVQAAPTSDTFQLATIASPSVALSLTSAGTGTQQFSGGSAMTASSIAAAIQTNARYTAELGAQINMLSYAVESMQTLSGNLVEAYSRIVDVDYAAETASLTRNQIMQEAATSMLAQANQTPNIILTLLS